ncbi:LysR family transcriptional regulator [Piscinibacter sp. HJYY11]|uniref:LysR family transcriptional regulator n=1 Tax=Piscinibacter sp. HJYY11 TaxID=2801333 RepID=UPI00191EB6A5|nr:LysR family transcriptional regulator [Piscinibacter sp. HJYY11]MBL0729436.1 LysR family transcriptional regulator [Piscinibacter sp. HJYY11]
MQLRQLKYFVVAIELGTLQAASKKLFIAQSAISKQIATLEDDLGVQLLERGRGGVRPTPIGEHFYQHAKFVLSSVEGARRAVENFKAVNTG